MADSQATKYALIKQQLESVVSKLNSIEASLEIKYAQATELASLRLAMAEMEKKLVTKEAFWPVRVLVFGATGILLAAMLTALVGLVVYTRTPS